MGTYDHAFDTAPGATWAGNLSFSAATVHHPATLDEVIDIVTAGGPLRPLGTRHSFNDLADTTGAQIALDRMPAEIEIDEQARTVRCSAALRYGDLAPVLHAAGWGLAALASLPHISIGGAIATGTHGSGDAVGSLAAAVRGIEFVDGRGEHVRLTHTDADLPGAVVALGALGVVTHVTLAVEPTYDISQVTFDHLAWPAVDEHFDEVTAAGDSVSLFTLWQDEVTNAWVKLRDSRRAPRDLLGSPPNQRDRHPAGRQDASNTTPQCLVPGPWYERLPHFRLDFTPSTGAELQSEWLLPRSRRAEAFERMRGLGDRIAPVAIVSEIRTIAADDLWLSGCSGRDTVAIHVTWQPRPAEVMPVVAAVDEALLPLGARPHWGKITTATGPDIAGLYERLPDFVALRDRHDPERVFGNAYLQRFLP